MKTHAKTDRGLERKENQDCFYTSELSVGNLPNLFIVADGMGGHAGGKLASDTAMNSFIEAVSKSDSEDVWLNKISELDKESTISLKLADGISAEDIVIVHNIHDGEEYEIIKIESYDAKTNTITFKTKSFSNYAIATKNTSTNPHTLDSIYTWISMFVVSLIGLVIGMLKLKKAISK